MQDPVLDFLGSSLVPVLGADVAAGAAGHIHLGLVGVTAVGADPDHAVPCGARHPPRH